MANWQAPSTNNERTPADVGVAQQGVARPYLDAVSGHVKWWSGVDALPAGATPLFVVIRASDQRRIFSTDNADERAPALFGTRILFR